MHSKMLLVSYMRKLLFLLTNTFKGASNLCIALSYLLLILLQSDNFSGLLTHEVLKRCQFLLRLGGPNWFVSSFIKVCYMIVFLTHSTVRLINNVEYILDIDLYGVSELIQCQSRTYMFSPFLRKILKTYVIGSHYVVHVIFYQFVTKALLIFLKALP